MTPHLLVDLDGVLVNFNDPHKTLCDQLFGAEKLGVEYNVWDWPTKWYGPQVADAAWSYVKNNPQWWLDLPPNNGTKIITTLSLLEEVEVVFATVRDFKGAANVSREWLKKHGYLGEPTVLACSHKGHLAAALGNVKAAIDDAVKHLLHIRTYTKADTHVYCYAAPHNEELIGAPYIKRIKTVEEMLEAEGLATKPSVMKYDVY